MAILGRIGSLALSEADLASGMRWHVTPSPSAPFSDQRCLANAVSGPCCPAAALHVPQGEVALQGVCGNALLAGPGDPLLGGGRNAGRSAAEVSRGEQLALAGLKDDLLSQDPPEQVDDVLLAMQVAEARKFFGLDPEESDDDSDIESEAGGTSPEVFDLKPQEDTAVAAATEYPELNLVEPDGDSKPDFAPSETCLPLSVAPGPVAIAPLRVEWADINDDYDPEWEKMFGLNWANTATSGHLSVAPDDGPRKHKRRGRKKRGKNLPTLKWH